MNPLTTSLIAFLAVYAIGVTYQWWKDHTIARRAIQKIYTDSIKTAAHTVRTVIGMHHLAMIESFQPDGTQMERFVAQFNRLGRAHARGDQAGALAFLNLVPVTEGEGYGLIAIDPDTGERIVTDERILPVTRGIDPNDPEFHNFVGWLTDDTNEEAA